ncbi:MAG: hypothetical protein J6Y16_05870 [Treponema sp.]|nr:hypothetical protein [Treponema sp.]
MSGYIAIPSHRLVESKNQKSIHFNTREEMEKHFAITPARMDSLLNSGRAAPVQDGKWTGRDSLNQYLLPNLTLDICKRLFKV